MQLRGLVITATISSLRLGLYGDDPLATVRLPQRVFLANHLASTD